MAKNLLTIRDLHAAVEDREIIKGLDLEIREGEVHVMMGPNGSGKTTLANLIMGHPNYRVTGGAIYFAGEDLSEFNPDERARKGIFLSFQLPEEIPGVTVENFLRTAKIALTGQTVRALAFRQELMARMKELEMEESYASRYVNVGFSGGEKKKNEIFQMLVLNPKLAILDETDSGLDVDAVKTVSAGVKQFKNDHNAILIITHNTKILERLEADYVHVLMDGKIVRTGGAGLIEQINEAGFSALEAPEPEMG